MLLTIHTTHWPATDLGYLLGKNPARAQSFELAFGPAHVFYPQAEESACTAALLLDLDPVGWCAAAATARALGNAGPLAPGHRSRQRRAPIRQILRSAHRAEVRRERIGGAPSSE